MVITEQEFERITKYIKKKAGINLTEKKSADSRAAGELSAKKRLSFL